MPLRNILQYRSMASLFCHGNLILVILLLVKGLLGWLVLFEELLHTYIITVIAFICLHEIYCGELVIFLPISLVSCALLIQPVLLTVMVLDLQNDWAAYTYHYLKHGGLFLILCWFFEWKLVAYEVDSQNSLLPLFKLRMVYEFKGFQNSGIFSYDIRDVGWTSFLRNIQITFPETIGLLCRNPISPNPLHCFHLNLVDSREPQRARVFGNLSRWSPVHNFKS